MVGEKEQSPMSGGCFESPESCIRKGSGLMVGASKMASDCEDSSGDWPAALALDA